MALQMLDVLIGVVVVFVVFSSAASMLAELVEIYVQRRGRLLEKALAQMFEAPLAGISREQVGTMLAAFYNSPAMFALFDGRYGTGQRFRLPSEIPPQRFAAALTQLARDPALKAQFEPVLMQILAQVGLSIDDLEARTEEVRRTLSDYYMQSMQRVSGWYRRHVQQVLFACGFGLAALMNVDTLAVIRALSVDDGLRRQMVEQASALQPDAAPASCDGLDVGADDAAAAACEVARRRAFEERLRTVGAYGLPIGWGTEAPPAAAADPGCGVLCRRAMWLAESPQRALEKFLGLLLTGLAAALGAPYWFELLKRLLAARQQVRGTTGGDSASRPT